MAVTKAVLRTLVARELKILAANRTAANTADGNLIDEYIDGVRDWLIEENCCYWSANAIPSAVKLPLAYIVASQAAGVFSVVYDKGPAGLKMLKEHVAQRPSGEPTRADFF